MKSFTNVVGILLILFGIFGLVYGGFTYTSMDEVAEVGNLTVVSETDNTVYLPPILGGLCLGVGIILVAIARRK